jgi:hypothetical protein
VTGARLLDGSFALFWSSRVLATLAVQVQTVALGWQLYALTGSALDLGLIGLVQFVPTVALTLVVGTVADRYDRGLVVVACKAVQAGASLVLVLGSHGGWLERDGILTIVAVLGAARAFDNPTRAALVPGLVPRPLLPRAIASATSAGQTARIVGPALGGALYALGPTAVYALAALLYVVGAGCIAGVRTCRRRARPRTSRRARSSRGSDSSCAIASCSARCRSVSSPSCCAAPRAAARLRAGHPRHRAGRSRAPPGGAGGGRARHVALAHAPSGGAPCRRRAVRRGVRVRLATVGFGLSTSLPLSLAALAALGAADLLSVVIRQSLVQLRTTDAMRGRVSAVHSLFTGTSNPLGEFESGLLAALFGAVPAVLVDGLGTMVVATLRLLAFPELRRFDR